MSGSATTLVSAVRYAFMMRRHGKALDNCGNYGRAPGVDTGPYDPRPARRERADVQFAIGTPSHPDGDLDVFSGR